jgi:tRNA (guanine37-N1)-methyltransferase
MKIDILTIFPKMFDSTFAESIVKIAQDKGIASINIHNLRKWTTDKHKTVDDKPFGGGAGMIMMIEPIYKALEELDPSFSIKGLKEKGRKSCRILLTAKGERIMQKKVRELSTKDHLILICGHYEGVDHRVYERFVDERISIGDFVLSGGEIPAMAIVDSVIRLIPGVLGNVESTKEESFSVDHEVAERKYIEYPQYTRPAVFKIKGGEELKVPKVLLSGDHGRIRKWREESSK